MTARTLPMPNPVTPTPCVCGGRAWLREKFSRYFVVECEKCDAWSLGSRSGAKAVELWNDGARAKTLDVEPW